MGHCDAHWSCEELLGTEGPRGPAEAEALGKETNQAHSGDVGSRLTHDFTRPSSAWGFPEKDQAPRLTHGHPQALRGRVLVGTSRRPL